VTGQAAGRIIARKTRSAMSLGPGHIKMSSVFTMALLDVLQWEW
jgi:hypothetical protein